MVFPTMSDESPIKTMRSPSTNFVVVASILTEIVFSFVRFAEAVFAKEVNVNTDEANPNDIVILKINVFSLNVIMVLLCVY